MLILGVRRRGVLSGFTPEHLLKDVVEKSYAAVLSA